MVGAEGKILKIEVSRLLENAFVRLEFAKILALKHTSFTVYCINKSILEVLANDFLH